MTTRHGGVSPLPYNDLNLGAHVGDEINLVTQNRALLQASLSLPSSPVWLEQVHGTEVLTLPCKSSMSSPIADASYTHVSGQVCVIMTADCLPILLCNKSGTEIAAVHAGWRGLCDGVIETCIANFDSPANELIAYLGPAIGPEAFEVGAEVKQAFVDQYADDQKYFRATEAKFVANLQGLAHARLLRAGVTECNFANRCTYSHADDFFSYRRDGITGRMASLIWLD